MEELTTHIWDGNFKYAIGKVTVPNNTISFFTNPTSTEVLKLCSDGEIYWLGRKVESDAELKEAVIYWVNILKNQKY